MVAAEGTAVEEEATWQVEMRIVVSSPGVV